MLWASGGLKENIGSLKGNQGGVKSVEDERKHGAIGVEMTVETHSYGMSGSEQGGV